MLPKNIFYAQSGGVTAVINTTACGLIETAAQYPQHFGKIYAGNNGILGALSEELIDLSQEDPNQLAALKYTPGGAFGSCRYKLKCLTNNRTEYQRLVDVFAAHNIGYFFYNGGGDSQDTAHKVSQISAELGYPIVCIGIPKTVDNDLPFTDHCPGFGSVAKYVAVSTREAGLDTASMCKTSTKIFILEVMGRHAGWIAAAAGLAQENLSDPPHLIIFPEVPFDSELFLEQVKNTVNNQGYCVIVVSEGARDIQGKFLSEGANRDAFGHVQLGGVAPYIAQLIQQKHGYKYHWAVADYLQRSARHIASATDVEHAYAVGKAAIELALAGHNAVMPIIVRDSDAPYRWHIDHAPLDEVANQERTMPKEFISDNGFHITDAARCYLSPLIQGEDYPPYRQGLPVIARLKKRLAPKKLPAFENNLT